LVRCIQPLLDDALFPHLGVGVESVTHALPRGGALGLRCFGVVLEPLVFAQCVNRLVQRQRAELQRDAGLLSLRTFFIRRVPHQALRVRVLPGAYGGLQTAFAVLRCVGLQAGAHRVRRRPGLRQHPVCNGVVAGIDGQRVLKVVPVAIQVDVFVCGAPPPRKAPGVESVHVEHGHPGRLRGGVEGGFVEQRCAASAAAKNLPRASA